MEKRAQYLTSKRVSDKLSSLHINILTVLDFSRIFRVSKRQATLYLSRTVKRGNMIRVSRGLYCLSKIKPDPMTIANEIYRPSYISADTALSYYNIIPETVYSITSITTKHSKNFVVGNQEYIFQQVIRPLYFGYRTVHYGKRNIHLANPEKALLDFLYFVAQGKRLMNDRIDVKRIDMLKFHTVRKEIVKKMRNKLFVKKFNDLALGLFKQ